MKLQTRAKYYPAMELKVHLKGFIRRKVRFFFFLCLQSKMHRYNKLYVEREAGEYGGSKSFPLP